MCRSKLILQGNNNNNENVNPQRHFQDVACESSQLLVTSHNSSCIFEEATREVFAWFSRKRVGKYGGKCVKERMGSFLVWKTQQASRGSLATSCWIKRWCFCESSNCFWKVCTISGFVYCVFLCGTNKLEPKILDSLAGYCLCTAAKPGWRKD